MLDFMRKKAGSWMIKFILGAIIVVFVFWGVGSFRESNVAIVASVNGEPIALDTYRETHNNLVEQTRQRFGNSLNDDLLKALDLPKQALNRLIDQAIWSQEALKLGFQVSDEEVASAISNTPAFQNAGVFDPRRYQAVLSQYRLTPEKFETIQKQSMLVEKLRLLVAAGVMVSDNEVEQWYNWDNASMRIDYVTFDPGKFEDIEATPDEIRTYYDENKENYRTEAKVKARYVKFVPEEFSEGVSVSEENISEYYETHPEEFKIPKTVEARHILLKVDPTATPEAVEARRVEAEKIIEMAKSGRDFAALAKTYSEGPTRDRGGLLGAFRREDMVKPFSDAAFAMGEGDISEPVKTQFGWHVIKVEKVNEASSRLLEEVSEEIRINLTSKEAKNLAYDAAAAFYDSTMDGENLSEAGDLGRREVHTTEIFDNQGPEGIRNRSGFAQAAFKLEAGDISEIEDLGDGYYVIQVVEKVPPAIQELAAVEQRVKADLIKQKQDQEAAAKAGAFLDLVKAGGGMEDLGAKAGLAVVTSDFFKRSGAIPGLGVEQKISEEAFSLSADNPFPQAALKGAKGYYVIRFNEKKAPDLTGFESEKAAVKEELLRRKQAKAFESWLAKLKADSKIDIQEGFLE